MSSPQETRVKHTVLVLEEFTIEHCDKNVTNDCDTPCLCWDSRGHCPVGAQVRFVEREVS